MDVDVDEPLFHPLCLDALHEICREVHGVFELLVAATWFRVLCQWAGGRWVQPPQARLSQGRTGCCHSFPPSTATPATSMAIVAVPPLSRCLQLHRYSSHFHLDVGALPTCSTWSTTGRGSITHGWAHLPEETLGWSGQTLLAGQPCGWGSATVPPGNRLAPRPGRHPECFPPLFPSPFPTVGRWGSGLPFS